MLRTDLALEAKKIWENSPERTTELRGVRAREKGNVTWVDILDREGAEALGKPMGSYVTLELSDPLWELPTQAQALAQVLEELCPLEKKDSVLVVGLGNRAMTPDALGPQTVDRLFVTAHLHRHLPQSFGGCRPVTALAPGVLANTGIESLELVRGVTERVKPACVICIDALATGEAERLCTTVQCCNGGIAPGSGVGNCREAFSRESLGLPVYAIGVPTVMDGGGNKPMMVTPRDIDGKIRSLSMILAGGLNLFLHPEFSYEDFHQFVPQ